MTLASGSATSPSTTLLGAGNHTVEADYSGDANYSASSGTYTQVVNQAPLEHHSRQPQPSRRTSQSHANLYLHGLRQRRQRDAAGITGSADLATTATTSSPAGGYPITVTDAGTLAAANYNFPSADFGTGTLTVTPFAASVAVGSTLPNSTYGQSISFTVTVSGGGTHTHGNRPVPGRRSAIRHGRDPGRRHRHQSQHHAPAGAGNHTIEADYSGDPNYSAEPGTSPRA